MYYVILPYIGNEICIDLVAYTQNMYYATRYAKQWECYRPVTLEYDCNEDVFFQSILRDYNLSMSYDNDILVYNVKSHPTITEFYYTEQQFLSMTEYSPSISEEYLELLWDGIYCATILCQYVNDSIAEKLNAVLQYILCKYVVRVILLNHLDINEHQDFILSCGLRKSENLYKYKDEYIVTEDNIIDVGALLMMTMNTSFSV